MTEKESRKGGISVSTENIFPVIKKWLYSEKEIFLRELVSNACDAVSKLKRLSSLGEYSPQEEENYRITVKADKDEKTLTVSDNGVGMTSEEVEKYICNIALSGAADFIEKYEGKDSASGIIGHFGLGFYSAFMVADSVEIVTKSYTGAPGTHWRIDDSGEYEILDDSCERGRGTDVILHINEEGEEYLDEFKCREVLSKYCSFMPVEIFFEKSQDETDDKKEDADKKPPVPVNDTHPLWLKNPSDCTDEEYNDFYRKVFHDFRQPLFRIHINADYPLNFKGILYFPPIRSEYDTLEGQVKLYYNQVFVADNIKEVIPDYLLLLRGVLDCPELPLNVSRSYLQNSGYVSKISQHITKKVADKLVSLFTNERKSYEGFWEDIKVFARYGAIKDRKFYEKVKSALLLKLTDDSFVNLDEYLEQAKETHKDKVYYTSDKVLQAQYVKMFTDKGIKVVCLSGPLDMQYISFLESDMKITFSRVDSDTAALREEGGQSDDIAGKEAITKLFRDRSGKEDMSVRFEKLGEKAPAAVLNLSESDRRFDDMMKFYSTSRNEKTDDPSYSLILNSSSPLITKLCDAASKDAENEKLVSAVKQIWYLSLLAQRRLTADELYCFINDSFSSIENSL